MMMDSSIYTFSVPAALRSVALLAAASLNLLCGASKPNAKSELQNKNTYRRFMLGLTEIRR